jgi:hypothetical protein
MTTSTAPLRQELILDKPRINEAGSTSSVAVSAAREERRGDGLKGADLSPFQEFCDRYWARKRFEKAIRPWRDGNFSWVEVLYGRS